MTVINETPENTKDTHDLLFSVSTKTYRQLTKAAAELGVTRRFLYDALLEYATTYSVVDIETQVNCIRRMRQIK